MNRALIERLPVTSSARWWCLLCLVPCLVLAAGPAPADLEKAANAAFSAGRFRQSAELFVQAAASGVSADTLHYNAACAYARGGDADRAFAQLQLAIDAGLDGSSSLAADTDLASLHDDPRWSPLLAAFDKLHPENAVMAVLMDQKKSVESRYFAGRAALADGLIQAPGKLSVFGQYYANMAQFVGQYDEASHIYPVTARLADDPLAAGYARAVPALPVVLRQTKDRRVVFLNESHGHSQTRAFIYRMLAPLRAQGFNTLALETLATTDYVTPSPDHCSTTSNEDAGIAARGYALESSGYYSRDPVYGELIREAVRLGFRLIAYDTALANPSIAAREQNQANNLACLVKDDPATKLVVLAGFDHIAEKQDYWVPGGAMAYRFKQMTGMDPLSVDTTSVLALDASKLTFAVPPAGRDAEAYALQNAQGETFGSDRVDIALFVPGPAHRRGPERSWLSLGNARLRLPVTAQHCEKRFPCLLEARRPGELADAVASDRCVLSDAQDRCAMFLPPGHYLLRTLDSQSNEIASWRVALAPPTDYSESSGNLR